MAGFLKNASKAIGLAGDYNENKRPSYKEKNTEDGILCVTAIAGIIAGGAALLAGIGYGVYKAAPHIKNWWNTKVIPFFNKDKDDEED